MFGPTPQRPRPKLKASVSTSGRSAPVDFEARASSPIAVFGLIETGLAAAGVFGAEAGRFRAGFDGDRGAGFDGLFRDHLVALADDSQLGREAFCQRARGERERQDEGQRARGAQPGRNGSWHLRHPFLEGMLAGRRQVSWLPGFGRPHLPGDSVSSPVAAPLGARGLLDPVTVAGPRRTRTGLPLTTDRSCGRVYLRALRFSSRGLERSVSLPPIELPRWSRASFTQSLGGDMRRGFGRPSPAMIVACIALFAALGGTVYAAGKINGKTIKRKSLPGNRVVPGSLTGDRLKAGTITGSQGGARLDHRVPDRRRHPRPSSQRGPRRQRRLRSRRPDRPARGQRGRRPARSTATTPGARRAPAHSPAPAGRPRPARRR